MQIQRCEYFIPINQTKSDGQKLSQEDLINIGYMSGRYGISLDGNLDRNIKPEFSENGVKLNINYCTKNMLEENLNDAGIKFIAVA